MRLTESASILMADQLMKATRRNSDEDEMGETRTPNLEYTWSWKDKPGVKSRSDKPGIMTTMAERAQEEEGGGGRWGQGGNRWKDEGA
jgi:hypothetical protein